MHARTHARTTHTHIRAHVRTHDTHTHTHTPPIQYDDHRVTNDTIKGAHTHAQAWGTGKKRNKQQKKAGNLGPGVLGWVGGEVRMRVRVSGGEWGRGRRGLGDFKLIPVVWNWD